MLIKAHLSETSDTVFVDSKSTFGTGTEARNFITHEAWILKDKGNTLVISQSTNGFMGKREATLVFEKH